MFVLCITVTPTYAYFTMSVNTIETGSGLSTLDIQNGTVNMTVNYNEAKWTDVDNKEISEKINPTSDSKIKYGPVWIDVGDTNITTKVDLLSEYELTNEIDNDWTKGSNLCEPFEVIVGDIDNFGCGSLPDAYDDNTTTTNHKIDVFPTEYDAKGTDRRMVSSRFYYEYKANSVIEANKWYSDDGDDVTNIWEYNLAAFYGYKNSNVNLIYDGYTDRAIRGMDGGGENPTKDCIIDGKNWRYLQSAEPITFKYNKIHNDEESVKQCDPTGKELSTIGYVESKDVKDSDFKLVQDGTVVQQPIKLALQPNCKYKLEYELTLNDKDNIDKNNNFTVGFHLNNIKIKGTQENNNGWLVNGTGYDYENGVTYKNTNDSNNSGSNSSNASKATDTKIYFEMPQNNDGSLWWQPVTPKISYTNENDTPKVINTSDISDISSEKNGKWYCGITSDKLVNAKIRVDEEEKELEFSFILMMLINLLVILNLKRGLRV